MTGNPRYCKLNAVLLFLIIERLPIWDTGNGRYLAVHAKRNLDVVKRDNIFNYVKSLPASLRDVMQQMQHSAIVCLLLAECHQQSAWPLVANQRIWQQQS